MLCSFLADLAEIGEDEVNKVKPWVELDEYNPIPHESPDPERKASFDAVLTQIRGELLALGSNLWNPKNTDAKRFLCQLARQADECVGYLGERTFLIKACSGLTSDPEVILRRLAPLGDKIIVKLVASCGGRNVESLCAMGYLGIKNSFPAECLFARDLLEILRSVVKDEAVKRGYNA